MIGEFVATGLRPLPDFRGRHRVLDALLPRVGEREAGVCRYRMTLDLSDYMQREVYMGTYEPTESAWVRETLRPGMTYVDVGANVGYYVAMGASLVGPRGRVVGFEPTPEAFGRLRTFVERNGIGHARCLQLALGASEGSMALYVPPASYHNLNASMTPYCEGMISITVPVVTLDSFLEENRIDTVHLLKIDVEGSEPLVLEGAQRSLRAGRIRALLAEFHPRILARVGSSPDALASWLTDRGFVCTRTTPTNRLLVYAGDRCGGC